MHMKRNLHYYTEKGNVTMHHNQCKCRRAKIFWYRWKHNQVPNEQITSLYELQLYPMISIQWYRKENIYTYIFNVTTFERPKVVGFAIEYSEKLSQSIQNVTYLRFSQKKKIIK